MEKKSGMGCSVDPRPHVVGRGVRKGGSGFSPGVPGRCCSEGRGLERQEVGIGRGPHCRPSPLPIWTYRPSKGVGDGVGAGEGASASRSKGPRLLRPSWDLLRTICARRASCSRDFILRKSGRRGWVGCQGQMGGAPRAGH